MNIIVEISKDSNDWSEQKSINKNLIKKIVKKVLDQFENLKNIKNFEISILLTDEKVIKKLNKDFCDKEKSTNVLSFPDIEMNKKQLLELKHNLSYIYLGDMAFCYQVIREESLEQNKLFQEHFIHLLVHSVLHLLGFDHHDEESANEMEIIEINILQELGIKSPY